MVEDAAEEARRKQALAFLASYIFKNMYGTNWSMAADISGYPIDWGRHNRLTRAQFFHDDDYLVAILRFITDVFDGNTQSFNIMTAFIFDEKVPDDVNVRVALSTLGVIPGADDAASFQTPLSLSIPVRLIDVNAFPDDFYRDLVHLTNKAYEAGLFATVPLLVRKLLENLVVDALRLYYGMKDITVFFDTSHGRFHDFGVLIDNARTKLGDFNWCNDLMNPELLTRLEKYRERGNASAHSMVVSINKQDLEQSGVEMSHLVGQLFKLLSVISAASRSSRISLRKRERSVIRLKRKRARTVLQSKNTGRHRR